MSDDLNVLITIYQGGQLLKIAVCVPHGMNTFKGYMYWGEHEVMEKWNKFIPLHCQGDIMEIDDIFWIVK